jgi:hypothetical protein
MDEYDDSDEEQMMMEPASSIVRKNFFEKISGTKDPLKINVPLEDNWRLVVTQVKPGFPCKHTSLALTDLQACLGEEGAPDGCRVVLKVGVGKATTVIGHFRGGQVEQITLSGSALAILNFIISS